MSNEQSQRWLSSHSDVLKGRLLDVGSYNENGETRAVLPVTVGVDMRPGPGVDVVCMAENLLDIFPPESFDAVVCANTLEHIEFWREALYAMWAVLKTGGWFALDMPNRRKGYHGYPSDYWRFDESHFQAIWPGVKVEKSWHKGFGVCVQKQGPLPDLSKIEAIPI